MPHLKIVNEQYAKFQDTEILIHKYVIRHARMYGYGGLGVDPDHAAEQMELYRQYYGKTTQYALFHWILSFSKTESQKYDTAYLMGLGYRICEYFCREYQILFGIHWHKESWDMHFVMNIVNYRTGKKYPQNYQSQNTLVRICETELGGGRVELDIY